MILEAYASLEKRSLNLLYWEADRKHSLKILNPGH